MNVSGKQLIAAHLDRTAKAENLDYVNPGLSTQITGDGSDIRDSGSLAALAENIRRKKIPKLDALRAVSVFLVVLYHVAFSFIPAGLGVMVFFVISGFLITWLLLEEVDQTGSVSLGHFYFRRTFRIFPAFYLFWAIIVAALLLKHGHIIWGQVIATFFYVGNYYQGLNHYPETSLSHAWSLGVEEQYYLLWPAVVLLLARKPQLLLRVTCAGIFLVWIYRGILVSCGAPQEYIYTAFDTRFDHLLIGCVVAISLRYGFFTKFWRCVCARTGYMLLPLSGLILSAWLFWIYGYHYRDTVGFIADPLMAAILMTQLIATRSKWLAWMDSAPLVYLGTISYSTYLYNGIGSPQLSKAFSNLPRAVPIILAFVASYAFATISYYAVEKPFLRMRARIESRYRQARKITSP
jgi:peptidoglycan/LPS O-acetylase OafA/YrhL